jgi:hypothetical protein
MEDNEMTEEVLEKFRETFFIGPENYPDPHMYLSDECTPEEFEEFCGRRFDIVDDRKMMKSVKRNRVMKMASCI